MKRYEPGTPRGLLGFTALALTAATFALAVGAPATMRYGTEDIGVLTGSGGVTTIQAANDGATTSIEVVAVRGTRVVPVPRSRAPQSKQS